MAGIRFPLPQPPDTDGFGDTYEETRTSVDMESGSARMRNRMRQAPRIFNVKWSMDFDEYALFEQFWEDTSKGAEREFDVQILDDTETLVWFTVRWIGGFQADIDENNLWVVSGKLRALEDSFETRPTDTSDLHGFSNMGITAHAEMLIKKTLAGRAMVGLVAASGALKVIPLYGRSRVGMVGSRGHIIARPWYGVATLTIAGRAYFSAFGDPSLILQFDAVTYTPDAGGAVALQFDNVEYYGPHII